MVDLLPQPPAPVTSQAPTPGISPAQIKAPFEEFADTLRQVGESATEISVRAAKEQAAQDLLNQKVVRNSDGTVSVENPQSAPLLFGPAGAAYERAMAAGTAAHTNNAVSQRLTELHQQFPTDAKGFKEASDQFLANLGTRMPPELHEAVLREGEQLQTQHINSITDRAASIEVEAQKSAIRAQIDDLTSTAIGLSRKEGGAYTPEFRQARAKLDMTLDALASNPLFKVSPDQIAIEKKNIHALLTGEAVVAAVDADFTKRGKASAQKILENEIFKNPDLKESDRTRLYAQGMSRLQFLSGDAKAAVDANRIVVNEMERGLADRKLSPDDPAIGMAIEQAQRIGDPEGAQRISAAAAIARQFRSVNTLSDDQRAQVLGRGGYEPVNQSIPPEGRVLLKQIGSTESGNRYDVRYGPNGGIAFSGFADHPDIAEPITSGPDVGKMSTAAGYYQFIASTWQAQKQKLGLKDFSPANQDLAAWDLAQTTYKEKTGKDLLTVLRSGNRDEIAGVLPALSGQWSSLPGGRQPAQRYLAPSLSGGPGFTSEDVQRNPFLLSAYVRSLAADPELRIQSAKQTAEAIGKTIDNGFLPSPLSVAEVNQAARLYPEKMGEIADKVNGRIAGMQIAGLPEDQRPAVLDQYRAATAGPDVHQINLASAALAQVTKQEENMREHPLIEGARRGWADPPAPIDPAQPNSIAPALAQRASSSARIGSFNHTPPPPLLDKDDVPKLQNALQGQQGAVVLASIAQTLKPDEMRMLVGQEPFRAAVTGMSRSGDPVKMNAAYSFMDTLQKQNPLEFDRQFPDGLKDLRTWQSNLAFYPADVAAKRLLQAYDPAEARGREAVHDVAKKQLESVSADKVVSKFSGWMPWNGAGAPVAEDAGAAKGALKADYDQLYTQGLIAMGDASAADKFATEKLHLKYDTSPTNGGRIMAYPPERYYPTVGGSHEWLAEQLDAEMAKQLGQNAPHADVQQTAGTVLRHTPFIAAGIAGELLRRPGILFQTPESRQYAAARALVSDPMTERDIAAGKQPSYRVILQDQDGRWAAMSNPDGTPMRFRFDPAAPFAKRAAAMEERRTLFQQTDLGQAVPSL